MLFHALPDGDVVQSSHHLHLDPLPRVVGRARRFVLENAPDIPDKVAEVLVLLTSELVTNAVLHARTPLEVGVTLSERSVLVAVHDLDLTRPAQQRSTGREGGWGLPLVAALAADSALERHPDGGKTAWFRISREPASGQWDAPSAQRPGPPVGDRTPAGPA